MGINHQAFVLLEPGSQHYIGSLSRYPRQGEELGHLARDLATEVGDNFLGGSDHGLGLVSKKTSGADIGLKLLRSKRSEILNRWVFAEQFGRDAVNVYIGRLGGENRRNQQLPCALVLQGTRDVGIELIK